MIRLCNSSNRSVVLPLVDSVARDAGCLGERSEKLIWCLFCRGYL